jgi:hypothetical protein
MGHVAHMGEMRSVYKILVREPSGKGPLRRSRHTWTILKWILGTKGLRGVDSSVWIGTGGELLRTR